MIPLFLHRFCDIWLFLDEYRRWKKERDELRSKLDEARNAKSAAGSTEVGMDPKVFVEMREIYISTLGTIKGKKVEY